MGRHLSQIKRQRQNEKLRLANQNVRSTMRTAMKKVSEAVAKKDKKGAAVALKAATAMLYRSASKNLVHKRYASRHVARMSKTVSSL